MSNIELFKLALNALAAAMDRAAPGLVEDEAEGLAQAMRARAAQHSRSGNTVKSIQVVRTNKANKVRIVAGGDLTTREVRKGSGMAYDYVRAEEFGTVDTKAIPFFYNTYRARKAGIRQRIANGLRRAID
jgi:HK97 gp10 family phage protein